MSEHVTDAARHVMLLAQEEAALLKHNYIGTEHLLLGLIRSDGAAAEVLRSLDVCAVAVRDQVRQIIGEGQLPVTGDVPFTPRAGEVLALALREARQREHDAAGPEHVLLALTDLPSDCVAGRVLTQMAIDMAVIRKLITQQLSS